MHLATVEVFEPAGRGLRLPPAGRAGRRPARVRAALPPAAAATVPGGLARPVWVDDDDFDLTYHVRQSAVPRPGSMEQLQELVARIIARPLDRTRPLWEMYLIEGLEDGRVAILVQVPPDAGRRRLHHRPRPGHPRQRHRRPRPRPRRVGAAAASRRRCAARAARRTSGCGTRARPSPASARARWRRPTRVTSPLALCSAAGVPARSRRCRPRCRSSAASTRCAPTSTTTARCAASTAAPSTTSCSPRSPVRCAPG